MMEDKHPKMNFTEKVAMQVLTFPESLHGHYAYAEENVAYMVTAANCLNLKMFKHFNIPWKKISSIIKC